MSLLSVLSHNQESKSVTAKLIATICFDDFGILHVCLISFFLMVF